MSVVKGFFTDPTICIGCKACEVACKEWNQIPEDGLTWSGLSYDHTQSLGHSSWRHVLFVEQDRPSGRQLTPQTIASQGALAPRSWQAEALPWLPGAEHGHACGSGGCGACSSEATSRAEPAGLPAAAAAPWLQSDAGEASDAPFRWIFLSDVCKHCEHAGCLEACPTGAIVRTEVGSVLVQDDICNGCGYCVVTCPFGVIDRRPHDGRAFKCTFCYDRQRSGLEPACATACPTQSIRFGPLDELHAYAAQRVEALHARGFHDARLYTGEPLATHEEQDPCIVLADPAASTSPLGQRPSSGQQHAGLAHALAKSPGSVGHLRAFSLTLGEPEAYNLPRRPEVPTVHLRVSWTAALLTSAAMLLVSAIAARRKEPEA